MYRTNTMQILVKQGLWSYTNDRGGRSFTSLCCSCIDWYNFRETSADDKGLCGLRYEKTGKDPMGKYSIFTIVRRTHRVERNEQLIKFQKYNEN